MFLLNEKNMRPIRFLDEFLRQSISTIAIEKSKEIEKLCNENDILIHFTDDPEFCFEVFPEKKEKKVAISTITLEHLWCACYFFYVLYQEYSDFDCEVLSEFDTKKNAKINAALHLYQWSIQQIDEKEQLNWPNNELKPDNSKSGDDINVTNELYLCAVSWMLHHEIAHIKHGHRSEALNNQFSREEEREADTTATHHILHGVNDEKILQKRGLGVVIAILVLISQDILAGEFRQTTHPRSFERIDNAVTPYFKDPDHLVYAFSTVIFHYHMKKTQMYIEKDDNNSWKENFESCLVTFSRLN